VGLAEAARVCGVSVATVRRRRTILEGLGAQVTPSGWVIPISALISCGLMPPTTPPDTPSLRRMAGGTAPLEGTPVGTPQETPELVELRSQLAAAERRAAVAEAVAAERERVIEAQALTLRMIEAAPATPALASVPDADTPRPPEATGFQWPWRRRRS
jgi:hypothetical protein